ncbi:hypothetical protein Tco_1356539, partial [Tanacetum coccineum]
MNNLETLLNAETLHEMDSKSALSVIKLKHLEKQLSGTCTAEKTSSGIVSDEEIDKQELEEHYGFMAKIQEVLPAESSSTHTSLEHVQNNDESNVFANERRHSEQPESINDTYVLEKDDSNVTPESSNICNNDNQVDQNALQTKQTELGKYTTLNDRTSDHKILQTKLNETLGLLARKDIDIQE